jgi:hypothetical protein
MDTTILLALAYTSAIFAALALGYALGINEFRKGDGE